MRQTDIIIFSIVLIIIITIIAININLFTNQHPIPDNKPEHFAEHFAEHFDLSNMASNVVDDILKNQKKINNLNNQTLSKAFDKLTTDLTNDINNNFAKSTQFVQSVKSAQSAEFVDLNQSNQPNQPKQPETVVVIQNDMTDCKSKTVDDIWVPDEADIVNYDLKSTAQSDQLKPQPQSQPQSQLLSNPDSNPDSELPFFYSNCLCGMDDKINDINDNYDVDLTNMYRQKQIYIKSYLEDPIVRGYNLDSYDNLSPLEKTGLINLEKEVKYPKPNGYIFKTSPAFKR